jgi:hypothetical protein
MQVNTATALVAKTAPTKVTSNRAQPHAVTHGGTAAPATFRKLTMVAIATPSIVTATKNIPNMTTG